MPFNYEQGQDDEMVERPGMGPGYRPIESPSDVSKPGKAGRSVQVSSLSGEERDKAMQEIDEDFEKNSYLFKHVNEDVYGSGVHKVLIASKCNSRH